jgi:hypothetical protein
VKSTRPLLILTGIIMALGALALWVSHRATPGMDAKRPLIMVPFDEIHKVVIDKPAEKIVLEKEPAGWMLKEPLIDSADRDTVDRFLGSMTSFTVGSLVSEKKDRHSTFEVQDEGGTRVTIYRKGEEKPVLDAHVGKQALGYTSSYYRPAGQDNVYIADNLPNWLMAQALTDYRNRELVPFSGDATALSIRSGKSSWTFSRSSDTWSMAGATTTIDNAWIRSLFSAVGELRAEDFSVGLEPGLKPGFENPRMEVEIQSTSGTVKATIGGKGKNRFSPDTEYLFGRTEGRETLLIIAKRNVDAVLSQLKSR